MYFTHILKSMNKITLETVSSKASLLKNLSTVSISTIFPQIFPSPLEFFHLSNTFRTCYLFIYFVVFKQPLSVEHITLGKFYFYRRDILDEKVQNKLYNRNLTTHCAKVCRVLVTNGMKSFLKEHSNIAAAFSREIFSQ